MRKSFCEISQPTIVVVAAVATVSAVVVAAISAVTVIVTAFSVGSMDERPESESVTVAADDRSAGDSHRCCNGVA